MGDTSEVTLKVRTVRPPELEEKAQGLDIKFEDEIANCDPLTGALIIGGAVAGGMFVIRLWREFKGGTVIDLTRTPVDVSRNRDLDYGYFLFIAKDGSVKLDAKDEPKTALERVVSSALEQAGKATIEMLKATVHSCLGANARLESTPA